MANLKPLADKVILKPIKEDEVTKSGIVLPDTVDKEKPEKAEVIAVGPGKTLSNGQKSDMSVQVGDKVMFTKYGPTEVKVDDQELLVAGIDDILAIIE
ncbi:co-chaperone GroES [Patescibacteria group bacterium]|nr:co-chaperone GroES [Patescibacteria group bacterium]